jgi:hypothetical protein
MLFCVGISTFIVLASLLLISTSHALIVVNACQPSGLPEPTCNNSCEKSTIDEFTCFQDPMGQGPWMFQCHLYEGTCFRFTQSTSSCGGPAIQEGAAMCGQCVEGSRVICNATGIQRLLCSDPSCNSGCKTAYSVLYGQCTSYTTPDGGRTFIRAMPLWGKCFALRVGYFNDTFCNSLVGERVVNSGECFSTSLNPLDEFNVQCGAWSSQGQRGKVTAAKASGETLKRLADTSSRVKSLP